MRAVDEEDPLNYYNDIDEHVLRVGCASAGEPDRPDLALQMVEQGQVHYACFDTLAERTLAGAQLRKAADPSRGYDPLLRERVGAAIAPALQRGTRLAGNMGGANPRAAARILLEHAASASVDDVTIGVVTGDDVLEAVRAGDLPVRLWDTSLDLHDLSPRLLSANAYLGFLPILQAFAGGADIVVTGRGADVAPFMAAMFHYWGWPVDDLSKRASAAVVGHLLECGRWVTGGAYEEPAYGRFTPDPGRLSLPLAEVDEDGSAVITKVPGTGGLVTRVTCAAQLMHEIGDPSRYLTPDVTLDMTAVRFDGVGPDRVRVTGGRGTPPPESYKVLLGVYEGWIATGEASFAGPGAIEKAESSARLIEQRLRAIGLEPRDFRADLIGVNSVLSAATPPREEPFEVRLRMVCRLASAAETEAFAQECQDLWFLPAIGAGGVRSHAQPVLAMVAASVPQSEVPVEVSFVRQTRAPLGAPSRAAEEPVYAAR